MPVRTCIDPTPPIMQCYSTPLFGVPRGRTGRTPPLSNVNTPISGIVIHCVQESFDGYINKMCNSQLLGCEHASMHYVIDGSTCQLAHVVEDENVAWGFQSYPSNFPLANPQEPYPGWPVLRTQFPNISGDFYALHIAIAVPRIPQLDGLDNATDCCPGPYGMTWECYRKLVQLVAWLAWKYDIPVNEQHIAFHDQIVERTIGCEECQCLGMVCFVCDVSKYCEGCKNPGDPTFVEAEEIDFLYGELDGCKVKISIENLRILLNE